MTATELIRENGAIAIAPTQTTKVDIMKKSQKSNPPNLVGNSRPTLRIKATVYHATREESSYLLEYRTVDGAKKTKLIGREQ